MSISLAARADIAWWVDNLKRERLVRLGTSDLEICTDASLEGWGAHKGEKTAGGCWTDQEKESHINVLELKAIWFGLKSLCEESHKHVQVLTDNTTALAYVKHMGGVKPEECNVLSRHIWDWCEEREIWLSIAHIPGVLNTLADFKSRHFVDNTEWQLSDKIWGKICNAFGTPEVNLFASRINAKISKYMSWGPDPDACVIDAFTCSWTDYFAYAFPPFSLIGRVLQKAHVDGG